MPVLDHLGAVRSGNALQLHTIFISQCHRGRCGLQEKQRLEPHRGAHILPCQHPKDCRLHRGFRGVELLLMERDCLSVTQGFSSLFKFPFREHEEITSLKADNLVAKQPARGPVLEPNTERET